MSNIRQMARKGWKIGALGVLFFGAANRDVSAQQNKSDAMAFYFAVDASEQSGFFIQCEQKGQGSVVVNDFVFISPTAEMTFTDSTVAAYREKIVYNAAWNKVDMHVYRAGQNGFTTSDMKQENVRNMTGIIMRDAHQMCKEMSERRGFKDKGKYTVAVPVETMRDSTYKAVTGLAMTLNPFGTSK